jgi:hypothetical protein
MTVTIMTDANDVTAVIAAQDFIWTTFITPMVNNIKVAERRDILQKFVIPNNKDERRIHITVVSGRMNNVRDTRLDFRAASTL